MSKPELARGLKQAIVADVLIKNNVTSFKKPIKQEVKERVIAQAQSRFDQFRNPPSARQITNYFFNETNHETLEPLKDMAARLKEKREAAPARRKPAAKKATARKASPRKPQPTADAESTTHSAS